MPDEKNETIEPGSSLLNGDELPGQYLLKEKIGAGGMGTVYLAIDKLLERELAIKLLQEKHDTEDGRQRFLRETKILSSLEHDGIVKLFSAGFTKRGQPYLIMEWINGITLEELLKTRGPLPPGELKAIFNQILPAVGYAHEQGIIHRDLSPANIIIAANGSTAKILDFGLARSFAAADSRNMKLTTTGALVGNATYMSPEQCKSDELSPQSDIYTIGCLLFQCCSGAPPFKAGSPLELMYKQMNEQADYSVLPEWVTKSGSGKVIEKCLMKDPKLRYESVAELHSALAKALESTAPAPKAATKSPGKLLRNKTAIISAVVMILACLAAAMLPRKINPDSYMSFSANDSPAKQLDKAEKLFKNYHAGISSPGKAAKDLNQTRQFAKAALDYTMDQLKTPHPKALDNSLSDIRHRAAELLAISYEETGDIKEAEGYFLMAVKTWPGENIPFSKTAKEVSLFSRLYQIDGREDQAERLYSILLQEKPQADDGEGWVQYAISAGNLAELQMNQGKYDQSIPSGMKCIEAWKNCPASYDVYAALANAIVAWDYWKKGDLKQQEKFLQITEKILNRPVSEFDSKDTAARAFVIAAGQKWKNNRNTANELFRKAVDCAAACQWGYALAYVLDEHAERLIEDGECEEAQSLAQKFLLRKGKAYSDPRVKAMSYAVLADCEFLKDKSLQQALTYAQEAKEFSQKSVPPSGDLMQSMDLLSARTAFRQLFNPHRFKNQDEAASDPAFKPLCKQYDLCKKLFHTSAVHRRVIVKSAANEYLALLKLQDRQQDFAELGQYLIGH